MVSYQKGSTPKTTIWRQTSSGPQLVKTIPGLPYGTSQTALVEGLGNARLSGIDKAGSGASETVIEVKYTLE
jgi:hypothetical protein